MSKDEQEEYDDEVAAALMDGSTYERLRLRRYGVFTQSIPHKLRLQSSLLFALAAVLPIMAVLPADVREVLAGGEVAAASPKVILLGLVGGAVVFLGGVALTGIALARVYLSPSMTESRAAQLLSLEEVASLLGLGLGGVTIVLTLGYVLLGHAGPGAIEAYARTIGRSPFAASGAGITVAAVATAAFVGGVALFVFGQAVHMELRLRLDDGTAG